MMPRRGNILSRRTTARRFGMTVFEMLRNEQLEHARIVLQSEAASLKEVSFRVGYNHVCNFVSAFTARYGAPPRQYLDEAPQKEPRFRRLAGRLKLDGG